MFRSAVKGGSGSPDRKSSRKGSKSRSSSTLSLPSNVSELPGRRSSEGKRGSKIWRPRCRHLNVSMTIIKMVREAVQSSLEVSFKGKVGRFRTDEFSDINSISGPGDIYNQLRLQRLSRQRKSTSNTRSSGEETEHVRHPLLQRDPYSDWQRRLHGQRHSQRSSCGLDY